MPKASRYEVAWVMVHPFAALKVKCVSKRCTPIYNQSANKFEAPEFATGGKPDALRHIFYMAAYAQKVKIRKLRKLGIAHEKANRRQFRISRREDGEVPDSLGTVMDLFNNEVGFRIGAGNKTVSLPELSELARTEVLKGSALIMKRKKDGTYLDCNDQPVDPVKYTGRWAIPKCLVSSNHHYID